MGEIDIIEDFFDVSDDEDEFVQVNLLEPIDVDHGRKFEKFTCKGEIGTIEGRFTNFPIECELYSRYERIRQTYNRAVKLKPWESQLGISPAENAAYYKTVRLIPERFISSENFSSDGSELYPWTIFSPAPKTWLLWEGGNSAVKAAIRQMNVLAKSKGLPDDSKFYVDLDVISQIHSAAIDNELQSSDLLGSILPQSTASVFANAYSFILDWHPGEVKGSGRFDGLLSTALVSGFNLPNATTEVLEYLKKYDLISSQGSTPLITISGDRVSYFNSGSVKVELVSLLDEMNDAVNENFLKGKKYIAQIGKDRVELSPIEFAAYIQKKFVSLHPYHEGVGRTSRYLQDLIMGYFELPYIPGNFGSLQEDITTPTVEYVEETVKATSEMLDLLEGCKFKKKSSVATTWQCKELYQIPSDKVYKIKSRVLPIATLIQSSKNSSDMQVVSQFLSERTTKVGVKKISLLKDKKRLMLDSRGVDELVEFVSKDENLIHALNDNLLEMMKIAASGEITKLAGSSIYGSLVREKFPKPDVEITLEIEDGWLEISNSIHDCLCIKDSVGPTEFSEFCYKANKKGS